MSNIIETEGLSKQYGNVYRVKDVDLSVSKGDYGFWAQRRREIDDAEDDSGVGKAHRRGDSSFRKTGQQQKPPGKS